jgi:hypothetical protein
MMPGKARAQTKALSALLAAKTFLVSLFMSLSPLGYFGMLRN